MKIKICILSLIMLFITGISRAEQMCVASTLNFVVLHTSVDGVVQDINSTKKQFSIQFDSDAKNYHRRVTGIASCNEIHTTDGTESGTAVTQNKVLTRLRATTDDEGQYCWCKMEPVYDANDTTNYSKKAGLASYWQYLKSYNDNASCAADCATDCANAIANNEKPAGQTEDKYGFRTVMFNSIW